MSELIFTDYGSLITTLKLALITTVILLVIGTPIAWYLSRWQSKWRVIVEAVIALPLVLPPTVLGFYLLIAFSPTALPGQLWQSITGQQLAFSFSAIVIGSVLYSLPFVIQPLQKAFEQIDQYLLDNAAMLGAKPFDRFCSIVLPMSKASFITATTLGFAHTVGEFGVVLMIGGNIPDETRVLSIALFDHVESFDYAAAHQLAAGLLVTSVLILSFVYLLNFSQDRGKPL
ncbi:molybdate ABC transporter permease subunit [Thalassotalea atypica]|uniref:molybdate ABC transporter permease subunit n=1 Tax=Thalassotalea atypica TaxID=2054316 RepID=UPI002573BB29|nr:molybdate ABC transporter permease subunit [Thalassotalea atypica]